MNAITKSGTNGVHGAAFEFLRNSNMDARAFFDPAVTVLKRNQFGYAVGGPALKNKLFWFTDYQGTRERRGTSGSLSQLPSVAQRSGVFTPERPERRSERPVLGAGADQASRLRRLRQRTLQHAHLPSTAACVFPGGVIPASAISPISANLLKSYIPVPNAGTNTFNPPSVVNSLTDDKAGQRVDYHRQDDRQLVRVLPLRRFDFDQSRHLRSCLRQLRNIHAGADAAGRDREYHSIRALRR